MRRSRRHRRWRSGQQKSRRKLDSLQYLNFTILIRIPNEVEEGHVNEAWTDRDEVVPSKFRFLKDMKEVSLVVELESVKKEKVTIALTKEERRHSVFTSLCK